MSKHRRKREEVGAGVVTQTGADHEAASARPPARTGWQRLPIWAWALVFIVPLVLSEFMFYQAGRTPNMVMFPIVWVGFWVTIWYRSTH